MRLDRLEIAGFLHFRKPAVLDVQALPAGLVAIVGPNGMGKTRLLDAAIGCLYGPGVNNRAFPSRDGTLAEYASSRDAYIETIWTVDGVGRYRARVNVDGQSRDADAVLQEQMPDGRWHPLNNGQVKTYREAVRAAFPSLRQLLASAYAAQGRQGAFSALDQRGRMELFADLCDLGHYAEKAEIAKRCAGEADRARAALAASRDLLSRDLEAAPALVQRSADLTMAVAAARLERSRVEQQIEQAERERALHAEAARQHATNEARLQEIDRRIAAFDAERRRVAATKEQAIKDGAAEHAAAADRQQRTFADLAAKERTATDACEKTLRDLRERIANNEAVLRQAVEIRREAAAKRVEEAFLVELHGRERAQRAEADALRTALTAVDGKVADVQRAKAVLTDAETQTAIMRHVPCGGAGPYAACRFLTRAVEAQRQIPYLTEATGGEADLLAEQGRIAGALAGQNVRLSETAADVAATEKGIASWTLAHLEPHLAVAEEKVAGYRRGIEAAEAERVNRLTDVGLQRAAAAEARAEAVAAADRRLLQRQAEAIARLDEIAADAETQATARQAALGDVDRTRGARVALEAADASLRAARTVLTGATAALARAEAGLEDVARQQAALDRKRADLAATADRLRTVEVACLSWQLLAKACSRDGLPKLEVDAAGPTVSGLCNSLLEASYGTRFTLEVVTQVARADGKGYKEEFDVLVYDNAHGGEQRPIGDLSGGERVIVEEALRGAIALFVNARNRQPVRTLFRDETIGALDPENAVKYMQMLRRIYQIGDLSHILFVCHNLEAAAMADARIVVEDGQPIVCPTGKAA